MNVKACAFLLLGVTAVVAIVDASTKVETPKPPQTVVKKETKPNRSRRSSYRTSTSTEVAANVDLTNVQPVIPNEAEPFPIIPADLPPPMFPEKRRSPCGPGGCPRR